MSTGRHARKRAARQEEELANEQNVLYRKEQAKEKAMNRDIERQRISTLRTRFGGQSPSVDDSEAADAKANLKSSNMSMGNRGKYSTPMAMNKRLKSTDPMRTMLSDMMLDNQNGGQ